MRLLVAGPQLPLKLGELFFEFDALGFAFADQFGPCLAYEPACHSGRYPLDGSQRAFSVTT